MHDFGLYWSRLHWTANYTVKFAVRNNENSRRTWTLTSLVVRIAHALGIHRELSGGKYASPYQPFEREMRRRLWCQICSLDRQASGDRGSDPIITTKSFSTQFPLHINDEDLAPNDLRDIQPRDEYTDITLALVCHEVFDIERRLNYVLPGESDHSQGRLDLWDQRKNAVVICQQRIKDKYLRHCNTAIPIQRYTVLVADVMIANMWLWIYRPLQRRQENPDFVAIPQPWILHFSLEVIEKAIQLPLDSSSRPFRWMVSIWVQWHALAVMIAELCVQTEGPLVERAWAVVNTMFEETAQHVADSNKGRLWRPIKKLMNKARAVRNTQGDIASNSASFPSAEAFRLSNQNLPPPDNTFPFWESPQIDTLPRLLDDTSGLAEQLQESVKSAEPLRANWDLWVSTGSSDQMDYNNDLNQTSWTIWESFVDDFQASGDGLAGQGSEIPPPFTW